MGGSKIEQRVWVWRTLNKGKKRDRPLQTPPGAHSTCCTRRAAKAPPGRFTTSFAPSPVNPPTQKCRRSLARRRLARSHPLVSLLVSLRVVEHVLSTLSAPEMQAKKEAVMQSVRGEVALQNAQDLMGVRRVGLLEEADLLILDCRKPRRSASKSVSPSLARRCPALKRYVAC